MVNSFQSQVITSKLCYFIYHIYPIFTDLVCGCRIKSRLSDEESKHGQQLSEPSHYIIIMVLYIPYLSCIYGPNLRMSIWEQVIRHRGQTWSTAFKAKSLHQNYATLYTTFILYLRTQFSDVESRAGYQMKRANMVNSFQSQAITSKSWYFIIHLYPVFTDPIYRCRIESRLSAREGKHGQKLSKPSYYIKIMVLYIPYLSCIYGPNLRMSIREQVIRHRGQTWSTTFKAKSLHQNYATLYTTFILYLRT